MEMVQWTGVPSVIVRFLADEDGKTYGYGYGDGAKMVFGHAEGEVEVEMGDFIIKNEEGFEVLKQ